MSMEIFQETGTNSRFRIGSADDYPVDNLQRIYS